MTHHVTFPGLGLEFDLSPIAFSLGDFSIYWYGIIIATGFLLATAYVLKITRDMNMNQDHTFDAIFIGLIFGVIGARLYYVVFYPGDKYIQNPMEIFNIKDGGLGIYGGIIAGLLAGLIVAKLKKMSIGSTMDIGGLGFLIGQGVGRWGNFINQEAFGANTDLPWGMYSDGTKSYMQNLLDQGLAVDPNAPVHPCFFYESMLCFLGFILLHIFNKKYRRYDGQTFLLYIVWYGIVRFFIEATRTDSLMLPFVDIKISQAVAIVSIIGAVICLILFRNRTKLTGCGNKAIMELNNVVLGSAVVAKKSKTKTIPTKSTVFTNEEYQVSEEMNEIFDEDNIGDDEDDED